jgi:hypothetical protein
MNAFFVYVDVYLVKNQPFMTFRERFFAKDMETAESYCKQVLRPYFMGKIYCDNARIPIDVIFTNLCPA